MPATVEQLIQVPLFRDVPVKALKRLARISRDRDFADGDQIVSEGDEGVGFYLIHSGSVDVTRGGSPLTTLGPNDYFGEMALLDNHRRSATVTARGPVQTFAMLRSDFIAEVESSPDLAIHLLAGLSRRLRDTDARLAAHER